MWYIKAHADTTTFLCSKTIVRSKVKPNPLTNYQAMLELNPFHRVEKKLAQAVEAKHIEAKKAGKPKVVSRWSF